MAIRELIREVSARWPEYSRKRQVDKDDPVYRLVTQEFPAELQQQLTAPDHFTTKGSTGAGNITAAPWIALFDRRLTENATDGYYVVYLFATDMSSVTLCLAFGTTQFERQFGAPAKAFPRMRMAATRLQLMFTELITPRMFRTPIDLGAEPSTLHHAYQQAAILSFAPYRVDALPDEAQLAADLGELLALYKEIVSSPLELTVERLVEDAIGPAGALTNVEVREFEPRKPRKGASGRQQRRGRRYSPESRRVGDAGERAVLFSEQRRLRLAGRQDLADRIRWHAAEREYLGWDISSFEADGSELFIEVKASAGHSVSSVLLTDNEWNAANIGSRRDQYWLYIVTEALSKSPKIERLRNPAAYVDEKHLACLPVVFELHLSALESPE